jgi:putative cardiolipin synthase
MRILFIAFFFITNFFCSSQNDKTGPVQEKNILSLLKIPSDKLRSYSGVCSLENGGESLLTKLWLGQNAQQTIDVQLFSFDDDVTGTIVGDVLLSAAERGVKVRLLMDDLSSKMFGHTVRLFDSHDNIEVRIYNPGLRLGKPHLRARLLVKNSMHLMSRMHNKLIVVDKQIGIVGGRNISDDYSDYDKKYNFRDRDLFYTGKVVELMTNSFEKFWNDSMTVQYEELSGKKERRLFKDEKRFSKLHKKAAESKEFLPETREKIKDFPKILDSIVKQGDFFWTNINYISDIPGKKARLDRRHNNLLTDSIISLISKTKHDLIIESPYLILTDTMKNCLRSLITKGVKIKVMTNSLASIDIHSAFSAYRKGRKEMLGMGIEVHEFKPNAKLRYEIMLPDVQSKINYSATLGFHSKFIFIDSGMVIGGSYNFDPRSYFYNTECMAVISSEKMATSILRIVNKEFREENSWHVTEESNPDKQAPLKKRLGLLFDWVIPKRFF